MKSITHPELFVVCHWRGESWSNWGWEQASWEVTFGTPVCLISNSNGGFVLYLEGDYKAGSIPGSSTLPHFKFFDEVGFNTLKRLSL